MNVDNITINNIRLKVHIASNNLPAPKKIMDKAVRHSHR